MFKKYLEEKEKTRELAKSLIGKEIAYKWSGSDVSGVVLRVHAFTDQLWVKSNKSGKEYYIFWSYIYED